MMKITQTLLSFLVLVNSLTQSQAQDGPPAVSFNFAAVDFFGILEFLKVIDIFGFFPAFVNNGCRTLNTVEFTPESAEDFFSKAYFFQLAQPGDRFNREDQLNCLISEFVPRDDLPLGYPIGLNNFGVGDNGDLLGAVDEDQDPPVVTFEASPLCLAPTPANPSKFISNLCIFPRFLGFDLWIVANEPDYIIATGGQPTVNRGDGFCSNEATGGNLGFYIATPVTNPKKSTIEEALAKAEELGLDTSVLLEVDQSNTDGIPCSTFTTPRGAKIPVK